MNNKVERAEFKSRRRAYILLILAVILTVITVMKLVETESTMSYQNLAWIILIALSALNLSSLPYALNNKSLGSIMNDEMTQVYRQRSLAAGFWAAIIATLFVLIVNNYIQINVQDTSILIASAALIVALFKFSSLELMAAR